MRKLFGVVILMSFVSIGSVFAAPLLVSGDMTITEGNAIEEINAYGQANITITGGEVSKIILAQDANLDMQGGTVSTLKTFDNSTANITGGTTNYLETYCSSEVIVDNGLESSTVPTISSAKFESGICKINGGTVGEVTLGASVEVFVSGGTVNGIKRWDPIVGNPAVVILGGTLGSIDMYTGRVTCKGGQIDSLGISSIAKAEIHAGGINGLTGIPKLIEGYTFVVDDASKLPFGGDDNQPHIWGTYKNGQQFDISLPDIIYDSVQFTTKAVCTNQPDADLTGDCVVNTSDLAVFASEWLDSGLK
ncbi:hypothetical protein STSP2_01973 [Anaerohalosphaera lusitana]|uniref:Uncharacterized protein n=1 Tax=Anaerohalosphaera lusitana TaxID=1936003 RepID=A0A1U9NMH8_9BACT|nr:hypothetical protein [Anaerohalosphaera lusitana]AQT68800.1 hypothetical protein STSP2_01973 [Anaerohalosphaera lusitana]